MNLFKHALTAASVAFAMIMPGITSAMPTLVAYDTVTTPMEQMQLLRAQLQWQEAQRRNESAPDMLGINPSPGPQANNCSRQRQEGGQTNGSCGTTDMMQGMMQTMGQMMQSAPDMLGINPSPGPQANNCSRQRQEGGQTSGSCGTPDMMQGMMQMMGQMMQRAPDMLGINPSPGPQANNCSRQRQEGGQTSGSCGTPDMMQGMMQTMGQMMRAFVK